MGSALSNPSVQLPGMGGPAVNGMPSLGGPMAGGGITGGMGGGFVPPQGILPPSFGVPPTNNMMPPAVSGQPAYAPPQLPNSNGPFGTMPQSSPVGGSYSNTPNMSMSNPMGSK